MQQQQTELHLSDPTIYTPPLERQVGGNHYKGYFIQPVEFIELNGITFCVANAIKYIVRHHLKNGRTDLEKAIHYCDLGYSMYLHTKKHITSNPLSEWKIIPGVFIEANKITDKAASAINHLCSVYSEGGVMGYLRAKAALQDLVDTYPAG